MVSQWKFSKKLDAPSNSFGSPSRNTLFEENRSNEIEACNETLNWVIARETATTYTVDHLKASLHRYLAEYYEYRLTPTFEKKILRAAAILAPTYQRLGILALTPMELRDVLQITSSYMLLNEFELLFLLASIAKIDDSTTILKLPSSVLATCEQGYVFGKENLAKKSHAFTIALILTFFVAMITKERAGDLVDIRMFSDVFSHLLSKEIMKSFEMFKESNVRLGLYNLIDLNDMSKKLDSEEPILGLYFRSITMVDVDSLPKKKQQVAGNGEEEMMKSNNTGSFQTQSPIRQSCDIVDRYFD